VPITDAADQRSTRGYLCIRHRAAAWSHSTARRNLASVLREIVEDEDEPASQQDRLIRTQFGTTARPAA